jgi:hypothetical protein
MFSALGQHIKGLAGQGVDAAAYKADLGGYLGEGGSNSGAKVLASTVNAYAAKCPASAIVITGWSQGALVAHKGLTQVSSSALGQVAGLVTFGDPQQLFSNVAPPAGVPFQSYCVTGTVFDPLCAKLPQDFKIPTGINDVVGPFASLPTIAKGAQEAEAAASLIIHFPGELARNFVSFIKDLRPSQFTRLLLTPQHFQYGNNGQAAEAASFIASLPGVKAALAGGLGPKSVAAKSAPPIRASNKPINTKVTPSASRTKTHRRAAAAQGLSGRVQVNARSIMATNQVPTHRHVDARYLAEYNALKRRYLAQEHQQRGRASWENPILE